MEKMVTWTSTTSQSETGGGGGAQAKLLLAGGLREIWILVWELCGGVEYAYGGSSNRRGDWREEGQARKGPPTLIIVVAALPPLSRLRGMQWLWLGEEAGRRPPWLGTGTFSMLATREAEGMRS